MSLTTLGKRKTTLGNVMKIVDYLEIQARTLI